MNFMEIFTPEGLWVLAQVMAIDLVLAGDNAIVIGLAAAGLPADLRKKAILVGIIAATVMRIGFALITTWLLAIGPILLIAGGALLLYVCWKMYRELSTPASHEAAADEALHGSEAGNGAVPGMPRKTFAQAAWQIVIADVSMSLDNVLAVAGAAQDHPTILIIGLAVSIALMGLAATFIARLLHKHRWIAWFGLAVILYVAIKMLLDGAIAEFPEQLGFLETYLGWAGIHGPAEPGAAVH